MSIKTLKNGPQKLLIIGPDPFISQYSPDHSPQPRIHFSYYEISGPDICSLICDSHQQFLGMIVILSKNLFKGPCVILENQSNWPRSAQRNMHWWFYSEWKWMTKCFHHLTSDLILGCNWSFWLIGLKKNHFVKFSFSEKATKNGTILLMVLTFT